MRNRLTFIATFTIGIVLAGSLGINLQGQRLHPAELKRTQAALERVMAERMAEWTMDKRELEAVRKAFNGNGRWDREQAITRVATALAVARVDRPREKPGQLKPPPRSPDFEKFSFSSERLALVPTAADLVDLVAARIRLDTVLEDILGKRQAEELARDRSEPLTRDTLKIQLQSLRVADADVVSASFDWRQPKSTQVITLPEPTVLWRLSGGASAAVGRYFVCCDWRLDISGASGRVLDVRWFDASDLALPPGNRAEHLIAATLPAGTSIVVGVVAPNFANEIGEPVRGGNTQIFLPQPVAGLRVEPFVLQRPPDATRPSSLLPSEVAVWHDDRLLRFRPEQR